ncbi:FG-GAP and VCBS repeat-containing protein [Streptomyces sp. WSLK1-5]|uniref:FG-GAP and VCBS repeat-containing protein n=1 Tax=unclassified Streptomyces TaxID=2593676 RepID=UPI00379C6F26
MRRAPTPLSTSTALAALLVAGLTPLVLTAPASAATAKYHDDFNGDGYRDLAIAAPSATVGGHTYAGAVVVAYGSKSGISTARRTVITQNTSGIPGSAEHGDSFGSALASGDLNNDGYADLVVSAPGEDLGTDTDGGTTIIVWGSASGLSGGRTAADPAPTAHDRFGQSLTVGDFNGDGKPDLAVGSTGTDVWVSRGGFTKSSGAASKYKVTAPIRTGTGHGATSLASGDLNGDGVGDLVVSGPYLDDHTAYNTAMVFQGSASGLAHRTVLAEDSETVAVGDIDGDGYDDLLTGEYWGAMQGNLGGSVSTHLGSASGVAPEPDRTIDQDTPGVPGADETNDYFGWSVSLGDVDGDGYADAAVSADHEKIGSVDLTGTVTLLRGSSSGLTTAGAQSFSQDTAGVPGANETNDHFGTAVHLADLNGDGHADLSVSAGGENGADGAVWHLRGATTGLTTKNALTFGPSSVGVSTSGYPQLGSVLLP